MQARPQLFRRFPARTLFNEAENTCIREVDTQALIRGHGALTCADVMSRDVVAIDQHSPPMAARTLLLTHDLRDLPVIDGQRLLLGIVTQTHLLAAMSRGLAGDIRQGAGA
jgi:CBS-domain-containing membrane protein